jgi:hypothetical protein
MIVIAVLILGAAVGALVARARNGNARDMAQYAAVYAIVFSIAGLIATIAIGRVFAP